MSLAEALRFLRGASESESESAGVWGPLAALRTRFLGVVGVAGLVEVISPRFSTTSRQIFLLKCWLRNVSSCFTNLLVARKAERSRGECPGCGWIMENGAEQATRLEGKCGREERRMEGMGTYEMPEELNPYPHSVMMASTFPQLGVGFLLPSDMAMASRRSRTASGVQLDFPGIFAV